MVTMRFVRQDTGARACTSTYHRAHRAAYLGADKRAAYRTASHKLGLGVVSGIVAMRLRNGVFVRLLRMHRDWERQRSRSYSHSKSALCSKRNRRNRHRSTLHVAARAFALLDASWFRGHLVAKPQL